MRQFLMSAVLLFGLAGVSHAAIWAYQAHYFFNGDPDWAYFVDVYYQVGGNQPQLFDTYEYTGPTAVYVDYGMGSVLTRYRWDRNYHQITNPGGTGEHSVWGQVRNQYAGGGSWYSVGTIIYGQVP